MPRGKSWLACRRSESGGLSGSPPSALAKRGDIWVHSTIRPGHIAWSNPALDAIGLYSRHEFARHVDIGLRITDENLAPRHDSDRKSTRLNSSHSQISYAVFC